MEFDMEKEFLRVHEVSNFMGIPTHTVYELIKRKNNPMPANKLSKKLILIPKIKLNAWLEETSNNEEQ